MVVGDDGNGIEGGGGGGGGTACVAEVCLTRNCMGNGDDRDLDGGSL